ncbi:MAG: hypothetical protein K6E31_02800 [bacterium]|nr:hypothetical protein [bacterium]
MRTEIFSCDFDIGDENHWCLLDEGAKRHGLPRGEILFVFRISFPDNRKDRSCVVPTVHNDGDNLLDTASSCVSWYSEERPSWDADVMEGRINRVRRMDNVTEFLPWKKPEDERLTTLFTREKQIPAFVVAVAALQDGFETIEAAAVFMDGDEPIDESGRMRNFFRTISRRAKEGKELPEMVKLKAELETEQKKNLDLLTELNRVKTELEQVKKFEVLPDGVGFLTGLVLRRASEGKSQVEIANELLSEKYSAYTHPDAQRKKEAKTFGVTRGIVGAFLCPIPGERSFDKYTDSLFKMAQDGQ